MVLMPGFIDTHFHGSGGDDVMANGADGIRRIAKSVLRFGTTGFLATTIAARRDELLSSISETLSASQQPSAGAAILGIHLEGPFINVSFKGGSSRSAELRDPNLEECRELLLAGSGLVKIMTLAPELSRWL
jgi:N-acetylglucosamine-6-phosphate deacetylase